jgi:hypothetical protein
MVPSAVCVEGKPAGECREHCFGAAWGVDRRQQYSGRLSLVWSGSWRTANPIGQIPQFGPDGAGAFGAARALIFIESGSGRATTKPPPGPHPQSTSPTTQGLRIWRAVAGDHLDRTNRPPRALCRRPETPWTMLGRHIIRDAPQSAPNFAISGLGQRSNGAHAATRCREAAEPRQDKLLLQHSVTGGWFS